MKKIRSSSHLAATKKRMNIVLVEPEIPPNTGNVARLCAATKTALHLIEPFGFKLNDAQLKRAGMDYWQHVEWHRWPGWKAFAENCRRMRGSGLSNPSGPKLYNEAKVSPDDYLVFGRETAGLPKQLLAQNSGRWLRIPMFNEKSRSLNLSNCVALVLFEALRQQGFKRRDCEAESRAREVLLHFEHLGGRLAQW